MLLAAGSSAWAYLALHTRVAVGRLNSLLSTGLVSPEACMHQTYKIIASLKLRI